MRSGSRASRERKPASPTAGTDSSFPQGVTKVGPGQEGQRLGLNPLSPKLSALSRPNQPPGGGTKVRRAMPQSFGRRDRITAAQKSRSEDQRIAAESYEPAL